MSAARTRVDTSSRAGSDQQKKLAVGSVFALAILGVLYFELAPFLFTPAPRPAAPPIILSAPSPAATVNSTPTSPGTVSRIPTQTLTSTSAALDPTLRMQAMLVTEAVLYTGSGRNIFSTSAALPTSPLPPLPKVIAPIRPGGNPPPRPISAPGGPPAQPPIDLKFFGLATSPGGRRQAFLLHGDDVFLAADGDIVLRKYRIVTIGPNSIQVEDLTNNNKQTLPLLVTP